MPRKLTHSEFYDLISKKININPERVKVIWQDIIDVIVNETIMYGTISIPYLGTVKSQIRGGKIIKIPVGPEPENRGKMKELYVEPYQQFSLKLTESFIDSVNGKTATMSQKRRQREAFRQIKREEEIRKEQFKYMEKAQTATKEMQERWKKRKEREMALNRMSKKKKEDYLKKENSYWDELEEAEELEEGKEEING